MKSNLLLSKIRLIQNEYKELLVKLLPKLKGLHTPEALDEINLFWFRHIEEVQLYLRSWFPGENSYVFTAVTYLDYDDNEHLPFILLGDRHILDDPLSKYVEIRSNISESKDALFLSEQIGITAEDNIKILENSQGEILILPVRHFNQANADSSLYHFVNQAFISLFNGIDSINDYFSKCTNIDDIMRFARKDIGSLVMFSEDDDISENFFIIVYGCIQQAVDIIVSCVEYGCIPYIRYPVTLHYISLLLENMLDTDQINKLRYKMSIAFIVYRLCDKNRLATTGFDDYLKKKEKYNFSERLFTILNEHGINEKNFIEHSVAQIITNELEKFYSILPETEDSTM